MAKSDQPHPVKASAVSTSPGNMHHDQDRHSESLYPESPDKKAWVALGIGLCLAVVIEAVPTIKMLVLPLNTLIHEFGHAVLGWLFGSPSIPAFDFRYGGGVTRHYDQSSTLSWLITAALAVPFLFLLRRTVLMLLITLIAIGLYQLLLRSGFWEALVLFFGHGFELLFVAIFLYRATANVGIVQAVERPLYATVGFFILIHDLRFYWDLMTSTRARLIYEIQKDQFHFGDFSRIADQWAGGSLETVAGFFFACCVLTPLLTFLVFRYQYFIRAGLLRIFQPRAT